MSKSLKTTLLLTFLLQILRGQNGYQNLVVNPSFEQRIVTVPPRTVSAIDSIEEFVGWRSPTGYRVEVTTTDPVSDIIIFDFDPGQRDFKAKTGKNVAILDPYGWRDSRNIGRSPEKRSYLEGELTEPLTVGQKYYVGFSVHFHCLATNNMGIAFALQENVKDTSVRLRLNPVAVQKVGINYDKKLIWSFVVDSFVADEAYKHCYIGNFFGNDSTATNGSIQFGHYVAFVDDVFVFKAKTSVMPPKKVVLKPVPPLPKVLNNVQFKVNSTDFEPQSFLQLDSAALTLTRFPTLQILIKGHTSSEGSAENNQRLSERRAEAVKTYLIQKGIATERLQTKGFGATQPISVETTEDNRRLNRRIEFEIISEAKK